MCPTSKVVVNSTRHAVARSEVKTCSCNIKGGGNAGAARERPKLLAARRRALVVVDGFVAGDQLARVGTAPLHMLPHWAALRGALVVASRVWVALDYFLPIFAPAIAIVNVVGIGLHLQD